MKITKDMIGKKVRCEDWPFHRPDYCIVTAVGKNKILAISKFEDPDSYNAKEYHDEEWVWDNDESWEFYCKEPNQKADEFVTMTLVNPDKDEEKTRRLESTVLAIYLELLRANPKSEGYCWKQARARAKELLNISGEVSP